MQTDIIEILDEVFLKYPEGAKFFDLITGEEVISNGSFTFEIKGKDETISCKDKIVYLNKKWAVQPEENYFYEIN